MNHCSPGSKNSHTSILLSKAIDGFLTFKIAEGLSKRTIDSYEHILRNRLDQIGDHKVAQIKTSDLISFLAWMRTDYKPRRWNGNTEPLSAKSLRNVYVSLRAFFSWLEREFGLENPAKTILSPYASRNEGLIS